MVKTLTAKTADKIASAAYTTLTNVFGGDASVASAQPAFLRA